MGNPFTSTLQAARLLDTQCALTGSVDSVGMPNFLFIGDTWQASTAYSVGDYIIPTTTNGYRYECTTAGTSSGTEPTWPTTEDNTVNDGTAVWTCRSLGVSLIAPPDVKIAFAAGFSTDGAVDYVETIDSTQTPVNWQSLDDSTSYYFYVDRDATTGALTYNKSTLVPIYESEEPKNPVSDQHWFDLSIFKMKVYNGSSWDIKQRIFIGEIDGSDFYNVVTYSFGDNPPVSYVAKQVDDIQVDASNWDAAYTHKTTEDAINGIVKCDGAGSYSAAVAGTDYVETESDPVFTAWDKSTGISITASQVLDFDTEVSNNTDVAANTTHRSSDGTDHTYIDQDVTSGSSPTFDGSNFTGIPDSAMDTDYVEVTGDTMTGALTLSGDPTSDLHAATKQYVDNASPSFGGYGSAVCYTVMSAKQNASGYADFIQRDSDTQITILAGSSNPDMVVCYPDGSVETTTSDIVVSSGLSSDDTYILVKEKSNGTPVLVTTSNSITEDISAPSSPSSGDYWLNIGVRPYKPYKHNGTSWVETQFVKLGEVTKTSGTLGTPISYAFNGIECFESTGNFPSGDYAHYHNIGSSAISNAFAKCVTANNGYTIGELTTFATHKASAFSLNNHIITTSKYARMFLIDTYRVATASAAVNIDGSSYWRIVIISKRYF